MIADPLAVTVVLAAVVSGCLWLEARVRLVRVLGAALTAILAGLVLSNLGVLPGESPAYDVLTHDGVSAGIALILINVDLRSIVQAGPRMLAAFAIGAGGTMIGSATASLLFGRALGPETWKLAGQFTGTYIGGGVNFAALGRAFDTTPALFTAAVTADVLVTALWMVACLAAPVIVMGSRRAGADREGVASAVDPSPLERSLHATARRVSIGDAAGLVLVAGGAVWLARWLASMAPAVPEVLWLTTLALVLAHVPGVGRLEGSAMCGHYLLLLFLASNGAQSVVMRIVEVGPTVFYFALTVVAVHGAVIFGLGAIGGLEAATLAVASQANIGGAASAMALASARGYTDCLLPGVLVGLLGYGIGNYAGVAVAGIAARLLAP
jgi:uncharacterized membrane protein